MTFLKNIFFDIIHIIYVLNLRKVLKRIAFVYGQSFEADTYDELIQRAVEEEKLHRKQRKTFFKRYFKSRLLQCEQNKFFSTNYLSYHFLTTYKLTLNKIIPKNASSFERLMIKPKIPIKKVVMAAFKNGKFLFTNQFCDSIDCLSGNFHLCDSKHQCLERPDLQKSPCNNTETEKNDEISDESTPETFVIADECFDSSFDFSKCKVNESVDIDNNEDIEHINDDAISISSHYSDESHEENISAYLEKLAYENSDFHKITIYLHNNSSLLEIETNKSNWSTFFDSIQRTNSNGVIGYIHNVGLHWCDLQTLEGHAWLNDVTINAFMLILKEKCESQNIFIEVIDTFWYKQYEVRLLRIIVIVII